VKLLQKGKSKVENFLDIIYLLKWAKIGQKLTAEGVSTAVNMNSFVVHASTVVNNY
jgi:hypothetical protein